MYSAISTYCSKLSLLVTVFITVYLTKVRAEDCGQEELARCAKPLQLLQSTTDLTFAPKREQLDELCPELTAGLHCIRSYTRRCMTLTQRGEFNRIYQGTNEVIRDLCKSGSYQDEFLKHSECLQKVKPQHELCAVKYQEKMSSIFNQTQTQQQPQEDGVNEDVKTVCCSFREYLDCSEHVARRVCGEDTGTFIRGFLNKMSDALKKDYCEAYYKGPNQCTYSFSSATSSSVSVITTFFSSFAIVLLTLR